MEKPAAVTTLSSLVAPATRDGTRWRGRDESHDEVRRLAAGLRAVGVRPGDRVAWWLPNRWEAVALYFATWQLGAVAAPLHHRLSRAEAEALLARVGPRALLVAHDLPHLRGAAAVGGPHDAYRMLVDRPPLADPAEVGADELAVLLATSGSEGRPKLVAHSRRALADKACAMVGVHGLTAADTVLMPAPLAHISGLLNGVLLPAASGMRVVLEAKWQPGRALDAVAADRVTFLVGPPTLGAQLVAEPDARVRAESLRLYSCGGAGVTEEFAERTAAALDCVVKRTYGSTEAPTVTTSWAGDPVERGWCTDGRPTSSVELRVDSAGELHLRGPELFLRYWDDPSPFDEDGWYPTGDLATIEDGWLTVAGRRKELIIRGGENISPREVESACASMPGVQQCVVVGYPDPIYGERVAVVVVGESSLTVEAVQQHCAAVGLGKLRWPERLLHVAAIPTLTVGKPDRSALRELLRTT